MRTTSFTEQGSKMPVGELGRGRAHILKCENVTLNPNSRKKLIKKHQNRASSSTTLILKPQKSLKWQTDFHENKNQRISEFADRRQTNVHRYIQMSQKDRKDGTTSLIFEPPNDVTRNSITKTSKDCPKLRILVTNTFIF